MMEKLVKLPGNFPAKLTKWKVKVGSRVNQLTILCLYKNFETDKIERLKWNNVGTVKELLVQEGEEIKPGVDLLTIEGCTHPTVMKDMCAECGADLRGELVGPGARKEKTSASIAMVHSVPELIVSQEEAIELGREDENRLLKNRKLVLLVDLDQTLIHTTNDNVPPNLKDVYHFQLTHGHALLWYHTKFRPCTEKFLEAISKLYELHICTFGVRMYAHTIASYLDPCGKYFSHRILSRDECFNPNSKTANLKALFPCGDSMVCIIDDREDVWSYAANLIPVKPYLFFDGTADINAPPGMRKGEKDESGEKGAIKKHKRQSRIIRVPKKQNKDENNKELETNVSESDKNKDMKEEKYVETSRNNEGEEKEVSNPKDGNNIENTKAMDVDDTNKEKEMECEETAKDDKEEKNSEPNEPDGVLCMDKKTSGSVEEPKNVKSVDVHIQHKQISDASTENDLDKDNNSRGESSEKICEPQNIDDGSSEKSEDKSIAADEKVDEKVEVKEDQEPINVPKDPVAISAVESPSSVSVEESSNKDHIEDTEMSEGGVQDILDKDCDSDEASSEKKSQNVENNSQGVKKSEDNPVAADENVDENVEKDSTYSGKTDDQELNGSKKDEEEEYDEMVEWDDNDDYLMYLEDILKRIHTAYYEVYDQMAAKGETGEVPVMKSIIPYVKKKVLKGVNVVFSGVIPVSQPVENSREYHFAKSLGANVSIELVPSATEGKELTTHLVAARLGTAKVNAALKQKTISIVNPEWLWACAERWERVDERLYPVTEGMNIKGWDSPGRCITPEGGSKFKGGRLKKRGSTASLIKLRAKEGSSDKLDSLRAANGVEPQKQSSKSSVKPSTSANTAGNTSRRVVDQRRFSETYNPLFAFSDDEIASMDKEVEELLDSESSDSDAEDAELRRIVLGKKRRRSTSSEESLGGGEFPKGWKPSLKKRIKEDDDASSGEDDNDDKPVTPDNVRKLFRVGDQSSSSDNDEDFDESVGSADEEMAAAVEKEFLSY